MKTPQLTLRLNFSTAGSVGRLLYSSTVGGPLQPGSPWSGFYSIICSLLRSSLPGACEHKAKTQVCRHACTKKLMESTTGGKIGESVNSKVSLLLTFPTPVFKQFLAHQETSRERSLGNRDQQGEVDLRKSSHRTGDKSKKATAPRAAVIIGHLNTSTPV